MPNGSNFILCQWHESGPLSVETWVPRLPAYLRQRPHAWIVHSDWYTKPVWVLLSLVGVQKLVPSSTGNGSDYTAVELPYGGAAFAMVVIVPHENARTSWPGWTPTRGIV